MEEVEILQLAKRISAPAESKERLQALIRKEAQAEKSLKIMIPLLILAMLTLSVNVIMAKKSTVKQETSYFQSQLYTQLYHE